MKSQAFEFKARNSELYLNVGGYSYTQADFIMFFQYLNAEDYIAYFPYGPEVEPSEENQGRFLEELSETLRSYLPKHCIALQYDLNWESHWCKEDDFDDNGVWKGLEVRSAGIEGLDIWHKLYCETANRNKLHINSLDYFKTVFTSKLENDAKDDVPVKLLIAYADDEPLAAMFLVLSSHRIQIGRAHV